MKSTSFDRLIKLLPIMDDVQKERIYDCLVLADYKKGRLKV